MQVVVAEVHKNLFQGEALSLTVATTEGVVTVLPKHAPFVANLKSGEVVVKTEEGIQKFEITGGVLEVANDQVTVLL